MRNLVVAFEATYQRMESLALALGLGAVQRGANIRFRHLSFHHQTRLAHQGYGRLKVLDIEWAECLAIGLESKAMNIDLEKLLRAFHEAVERSNSDGKSVYVFEDTMEDGQLSFAAIRIKSELGSLGFKVDDSMCYSNPSIESMTLFGNRLADS